jgi:hypothetical protein
VVKRFSCQRTGATSQFREPILTGSTGQTPKNRQITPKQNCQQNLVTDSGIRYDYGNCYYPSKESPFFTSGRLIIASLVSFLIIYVKGIEFLAAKVSKRIDPIIIILLVVLYSAYSEIATILAHGVFSSPYNFFHL